MEDNKDLKMKISNFIQDKDQEKNLIYIIQNLERKHEVIDYKYQKAQKYLKKNSIEIPSEYQNSKENLQENQKFQNN